MSKPDMEDVSSDPPVPRTQRIPRRRVAFSDVLVDNYEWLRNVNSPAVSSFVAAQNTYTKRRMAPLAGLRMRLFDELKGRVQETDASVPTRVHGFWYFTRTLEGKQYAVQCRIPANADDGRGSGAADRDPWSPPQVDPGGMPGSLPGEQVIFDANREAVGHGFFKLGGFDLSRDGRRLLYGVDTAGNERYTLHVRDLASGRDLPEVVDNVAAGGVITPDGQWMFYVRLDDAWRPYAVWRHHVGTPVSDDVLVFRESDERFWVGVSLSFDETRVMIDTSSKTTTEMLTLSTDDPLGDFTPVMPRRDGVEYDVDFGRLPHAAADGSDVPVAVLCHNATDPNFQVDVVDMRGKTSLSAGDGVCVAAGSGAGCEHGGAERTRPIDAPDRNPSNPTVLQGARGLAIGGLAIHRHFVALAYRADALPRLAVMTTGQAASDYAAGRPWSFRRVGPAEDGILPAVGAVASSSYEAPRMRYVTTSFTTPPEVREVNPATGGDALLKRATVLGDYHPRDYGERRLWITARDGSRIPVSLVWRRGLAPALDTSSRTRQVRPSPMFITGYGSYEISSDPYFSYARLSLLDRGAVYAVAHIRGGGEMGRAWYEQGRRRNKKHSFEDFVDAASVLQRLGIADPRRTVACGASAGGLLMGAVANMAPRLFAGIEADVPFVDALTTILRPDLPLTVTEWDEWGDPLHDPRAYAYMRSYSPYENVPTAQERLRRFGSRHFPRILITTSLHDTRVLAVEPLKWLARLQEPAVGADAMIRVETEAGHSGSSGRYRQWRELCYENAWCLAVMGITR